MRQLFRNTFATIALPVTVPVLLARLAFARPRPPEPEEREWSCEDSWAARDYERHLAAVRMSRR
jgi:hypothetical protein